MTRYVFLHFHLKNLSPTYFSPFHKKYTLAIFCIWISESTSLVPFYAHNAYYKKIFGTCISPFDQVGSHYTPTSQPHPDHAGDLPPLFSTFGYAWTIFYDGRVSINEIIGKSIIIHSNKDDFTPQPSGNSGKKIACGVIQSI